MVDNDWIKDNTYKCWEFKPTFWQKTKLFFSPVIVSVDFGKEFSCVITAKKINDKIIITNIKRSENDTIQS